jgi:hypothetical protein
VQANLFQTIRQTAYNAASQSGTVDRTRISNSVATSCRATWAVSTASSRASFGDENASNSGAAPADT